MADFSSFISSRAVLRIFFRIDNVAYRCELSLSEVWILLRKWLYQFLITFRRSFWPDTGVVSWYRPLDFPIHRTKFIVIYFSSNRWGLVNPVAIPKGPKFEKGGCNCVQWTPKLKKGQESLTRIQKQNGVFEGFRLLLGILLGRKFWRHSQSLLPPWCWVESPRPTDALVVVGICVA